MVQIRRIKMIPLMNLDRQYASLQEQLDEAALKVLHSGNYILGEEVTEFEKEFANYCGVKYAVGVGNGTDALIIALQACGIKPGDEVITCAMSFFATAEAIGIVGATPVFVDCKKDTFVIDSAKIEEKITNKTKAIIPIHLYGQCAEMDEIKNIAKKYNLKVVVKNKIVTEEEQIVLASILQKYVESKGNIYNDQLLGQVTDLFIDLPKEIILNKTCYFSNKATNDIVYSKFCSKTKQTYEFNGYKFTLDANNQLYDLRDSNAANIIGVSTIILTNDNHLILSIQNSNSDESAGLIVATGSGSATVKDYQKHQSFYEFLTTGMERELIEETSNSLRYKDLSLWFRLFNQKIIRTYKNQEKQLQSRLKELFKPNSTKVYCYNTILHRGGKPDFFGITKVNVSSTEIKPLIDDCNRHTKE